MKTMFDTSVLVAAMVSTHQHHGSAAPWLQRAHAGEFPWFIGAHSLAECYATLSAPVRSLGFPPLMVAQIIRQNLTERGATLIELTASDYQKCVDRVAVLGLEVISEPTWHGRPAHVFRRKTRAGRPCYGI